MSPRDPAAADLPRFARAATSRRSGDLLDGPLDGLFGGVHVLPPFPSSGDRGFAPLTYREIDPRFGTWADIERIADGHDVLLDLMVNHLSRQSAEFRDFEQHGRASPSADLFITLDKVWPDGDPPADGRRADLPAQARRAVLDGDDRLDRRAGARLDVVRERRTGPSRSTSTCTSAGDARADHSLARLLRGARRPDRPARRRRAT